MHEEAWADLIFEVAAAEEGSEELTVTATRRATKIQSTPIAITAVATVRGRVVDAAGKPVAMTPVLAMPVVGDGAHGVMTVEGSPELTDAAGNFAIEVDPGEKELLVLGRGSGARDADRNGVWKRMRSWFAEVF